MSDQNNAAVTPWWTVPDDPTAAAVLDAQMRIIDAAVRSARRHDWCTSFEAVMALAFPDGPPDGSSQFVDSDGWSCRGYDREGFNEYGTDADGYDREGFRDGRDRDGYDRDGFDRTGFSRDGWNRERTISRDSDEYRERFRFDRHGYGRDGFNASGLNRNGYTREEQARLDLATYVYDSDGYNVRGVTHSGYDREGRYIGRG